MEVHKESITITVLPEGAKTMAGADQLPNDLPRLKRWPAGSFCYASSRLFKMFTRWPGRVLFSAV